MVGWDCNVFDFWSERGEHLKSGKHKFKCDSYLMREPEIVCPELRTDVENVFYYVARFDDANFFRFVELGVFGCFTEGIEDLLDGVTASAVQIYFAYLEVSWDDY